MTMRYFRESLWLEELVACYRFDHAARHGSKPANTGAPVFEEEQEAPAC